MVILGVLSWLATDLATWSPRPDNTICRSSRTWSGVGGARLGSITIFMSEETALTAAAEGGREGGRERDALYFHSRPCILGHVPVDC